MANIHKTRMPPMWPNYPIHVEPCVSAPRRAAMSAAEKISQNRWNWGNSNGGENDGWVDWGTGMRTDVYGFRLIKNMVIIGHYVTYLPCHCHQVYWRLGPKWIPPPPEVVAWQLRSAGTPHTWGVWHVWAGGAPWRFDTQWCLFVYIGILWLIYLFVVGCTMQTHLLEMTLQGRFPKPTQHEGEEKNINETKFLNPLCLTCLCN